MTLPDVLAIAGFIALVIGLVGGEIKAKDTSIPKIPLLPRGLLSVVGLILIVVAIWLSIGLTSTTQPTNPQPTESNFRPTSTSIPTSSPTPSMTLPLATSILIASPSPQPTQPPASATIALQIIPISTPPTSSPCSSAWHTVRTIHWLACQSRALPESLPWISPLPGNSAAR